MRYEFLNVQPLGKIQEDCVCRAISGALDEDYYLIENKLHLIAELFDCEELCVCCYKYLLDNVYDLKRIESFQGLTIEEFLNICDYGTYIIRVKGHLTWACNGVLKDIWDCRKEVVDLIWQVDE